MIYYVYTLNPCDWWAGFVPVDRFLAGLDGDVSPESGYDEDPKAWVEKMRSIISHAVYWEGNPHTECVSALPGVEYNPVRFFSAKQPNNGTTFLVSPVPIWHLHKDLGYSEVDMRSMVELRLVEWKDG